MPKTRERKNLKIKGLYVSLELKINIMFTFTHKF